MGFLDKAKQVAAQAQEKLETTTQGMQGSQDRKAADTWFRELGQWVYLDRMGRDPRAAAEIDVRIQQLSQIEQQVGPFTAPMPTPGTGTGPAGPGAAPAAPTAPAPTAPAPTAPAPAAPTGGGGAPNPPTAPPGTGASPPGSGPPPAPSGPPPGTGGMASPPGG